MTIFMSWFIAPILSGGFAAVIFLLNKFIILRRKNSFTWAFWSLPVLVLFTVSGTAYCQTTLVLDRRTHTRACCWPVVASILVVCWCCSMHNRTCRMGPVRIPWAAHAFHVQESYCYICLSPLPYRSGSACSSFCSRYAGC